MDRNIKTKIIAENIRTTAMSKGLTLEKLAEKTGYKVETLQKYYAGERQARSYMLYKIAKATGHSMEWFMLDVEEGAGMKPHGRLIDADELAKTIGEAIKVAKRLQMALDKNGDVSMQRTIEIYEAVLKEIEIAETIVEAEQ